MLWLQALRALRQSLAEKEAQLSEHSAAAHAECGSLKAAAAETVQKLAAQDERLLQQAAALAETRAKLAEAKAEVSELEMKLAEAANDVEQHEKEAVQQLMAALQSEREADDELAAAQACGPLRHHPCTAHNPPPVPTACPIHKYCARHALYFLPCTASAS